MAVRDRFVHVPAKVVRRAIEPVVDQFRDFSAPDKGSVEGVVIDAVLGKQTRKARAVATFDGVTESAKQSDYVHPTPQAIPREPVNSVTKGKNFLSVLGLAPRKNTFAAL
jgi:hypothetical protein